MSDKIRWGILATGNIAAQFAGDLKHSQSGVLAAAASRELAKAEAFCAEHGGEAVTSYDALIARNDVDAICFVLSYHASR